jgi:transposase
VNKSPLMGYKRGMSDEPRIRFACRNQLEMRAFDLESTVPEGHPVRGIWALVDGLTLDRFYEKIAARGSAPGRPATDPKILVSLWIFATSQGIGSARQLAALTERHDAYRWICGGVTVNYHTLSDFRVEHGAEVEELLEQTIAVLTHQKVITLTRVAQDGMRVRASAGAASFRRRKTLGECLVEAQSQLTALRRELDADPGASSARERAAKERAARERELAIKRALAEMPLVEAVKNTPSNLRRDRNRGRRPREARVSTTDPEARTMKMADGGYRPAYNIQFATDVDGRAIVGVRVTNVGSDQGQMTPMIEDLVRLGRVPAAYLVDGGFTKKDAIEDASRRGITVYAPPPEPRTEDISPYEPKPGDSPAVAAWRRRMGTTFAKNEYRYRAATAELVNADLRAWRGLDRLRVRGLEKVKAVTCWAALTFNAARVVATRSAA